MSVAYYIVVESENPGFDTAVNGKSLPHAEEELDAMAKVREVKPLTSFFSGDDDSRAFLEEEAGLDASQIEAAVKTEWFTANDGLTTVAALLSEVRNRLDLNNAARIIADLEEFQVVLKKTAERSLRWHLAIDI
jgi:hypothetical protein